MIHLAPLRAGQLPLLSQLEAAATPYPWSEADLSGSFSSSSDCRAIMLDSDLVGYFVLQRVKDEAELLNIVIFRAWQSRGYGYQALQKIKAELQQAGIRQLFLEVRASNRAARSLYTRTGFELIDRRKNYYRSRQGREAEDALMMRCALDPESP